MNNMRVKVPSLRSTNEKKRGFVLLVSALSILGLMGAVGLAVDIGRVYIGKNETQIYTDSAALAATMELDGTVQGLNRARAQVAANTNRWNFATSGFSGTQVQFGTTPTGPWDATPDSPKGYRYVNVIAQTPVPLLFLPVVTSWPRDTGPMAFVMISSPTLNVHANSASGQQAATVWNEGLLPFSPYAHNNTAPHFGLEPGQLYTLRWASNPILNKNTCPGDNSRAMLDLESASGASERGYIEDNSADVIRAAIETDYQTFTRQIGDSVKMTGGAKETERDSLIVRINQDSDPSSATYADYVASGTANGRRLVGVPINTGAPKYTIVQIGAFLLQPASAYGKGGNTPWCAEYVGAWVKGSRYKGVEDSGAYLARLVR